MAWYNEKLTDTEKFAIAVAILAIAMWALNYKGDELPPPVYELPPPEKYSDIKGIDYTNSTNGVVRYKYYTDEEIRIMREQNPHLIIKIPGRRILSREAQLESDIEEYLQAHPEILDDHEN